MQYTSRADHLLISRQVVTNGKIADHTTQNLSRMTFQEWVLIILSYPFYSFVQIRVLTLVVKGFNVIS